MAETFSIDPGQPVAPRPGAGEVAVMSQIQPAAVSPGVAPMAQPDTGMNQATIQALLKLGSDALQPKIKEAAQQQFMEGVQRASTGAAVKDIVDTQPWYTQTFGPSAAVAGARGYSVATTIAQFGSEMEKAMPELAKQGPEALNARVQEFMKANQTGDTAADAAITSQVVDQLAPLYKRQAKEQYALQQREANKAQTTAFTSAAGALQERFAANAKDPTKVTDADVQAEGDRFIGLMNPFPGQTDESFEKNVARTVAAAGDTGNFQAIKLLKDRGIYDRIDPAIRTNLDASLRASAGRTLSKLQGEPEWAGRLAATFYDMTQNPASIPARVKALNEQAAKESGVPAEYGSLIAPQTVDGLMGRVATSQLADTERAARAGMKQAADLQKQSLALAMVGSAQGAKPALAIGAVEAADVQAALGGAWQSTQDPAARAALLARNYGVTSEVAKRELADPIIAGAYTPALNKAADTFAAMNPDTRGVYFNDDQIGFLNRYQALRSGGDLKGESAYLAAKTLHAAAKSVLSDSDKTGSAKAIRKWAESRYSNLIGWNTVNDHDLGTIQGVASASFKKVNSFGSVDDAARAALARGEHSGLIEKLGGRVVIGAAESTSFRPTTDILAKGTPGQITGGQQEVGDAFEAVLAKGAATRNVDADKSTIMRMADVGGQPRFMVFGYKDSGEEASWAITGEEIRANIGEHKVRENTDAQKRALLAKQLDDRTPPTNARFMGIGQYQVD